MTRLEMQANKSEIQIFPESEEAAKFVTGISGWVDCHGEFHGANERAARYSGSTHRHCDCGTVISKNSYCNACVRSREIEKYQNAQKIEWDLKTPLYSQVHDEYFNDYDDLVNCMEELGITDPENLELFICEPVMLSEIQSDYWVDDLPEDGELPPEVEAALEEFNAVIRKSKPVSWSPGKFAAIVDLDTPFK